MQGIRGTRSAVYLGLILALPGLGACQLTPNTDLTTGSIGRAKPVAATSAERECLARAMYFESNRSDEEGLLAVGTVVMNRVDATAYPDRICDVVGQPRQFATGVLTKPMRVQDRPRIEQVADAVLAGERHPQVGRAMFFHTAGRRYPYGNMHYVALAGGNAFYEKRGRGAPATVAAIAQVRSEPEVAAAQTILNEPARNICRVAALGAASHG
ncbi:cell wall hydrolase [Methylobacterium durans]|uniref:cell wall hydrolase n=1 Tax=Methylobacterium durans TaxID=2202825 RepID=UPI002AFE11C0|nr:cell wall hydrolase [Methylobacterium durans]MEA1834593.1 cell wall hydrolase [Methylobacterium durans]